MSVMLARPQPYLQAFASIKDPTPEFSYWRPFPEPAPAIKRSFADFQFRCGFILFKEIAQEVASAHHAIPRFVVGPEVTVDNPSGSISSARDDIHKSRSEIR